MSKLTTLFIHDINAYQIFDFFDDDHLPKLKSLSVHHGEGKAPLSSHLNLWRRHKGVQSLALTLNFLASEEEDFAGKMVDVFPAVKEFELVMSHTLKLHSRHHPHCGIVQNVGFGTGQCSSALGETILRVDGSPESCVRFERQVTKDMKEY